MPIEFNCESCSKLLRVPDGSGGKQCLCPGCSKVLDIPIPKIDARLNEDLASSVGSSQQTSNQPAANSESANGGTDIALCIPCPKCKHELICDPSLVGTKGQCRACKHIFVISDLPNNAAATSEPAINWVFSCPKCNQLFEGNETMRGRRGKCHACGDVFTIDLRIADENPIASQNTNQSQHKAPLNSFDSLDGELTLDAIPDETQSAPVPAAKPKKTVTSSGTVVSKVARGDLPPIQFNCKNCKGRMEVPSEAADQLTHCPHCKKQQTIPSESEPTQEELAANDPWADLTPLGPAPTPLTQSNPFGDTLYPPPMPMSSMTSSRKRGASDRSGQYIACGIFISLCALFGIAVELFYIFVFTVSMMRPNVPSRHNIDLPMDQMQVLIFSCLLILSIVQLIGGIALALRKGRTMARTGAIICCLPCVCLFLNIPFGVWGCVLTFGQNSDRDFR